MDLSKADISSIVQEVIERMSRGTAEHIQQIPVASGVAPQGRDGLFSTMEEAIQAARIASEQMANLSVATRKVLIAAMRTSLTERVEEIAALAVSETGLGKIPDKIGKNILAINKTPGVEDITPLVYTGDDGLTLVERAPYGVIGAITPSTNPSETVICNGIGMLAAGNSVVFSPHPSAKQVTAMTIATMNRAVVNAGGPANIFCGVTEPTRESVDVLLNHPSVRLLVVTGGPEIVRIAMNSGKKVIAAGPGNPPVVVDATADIDEAAKCIVDGASFDNNVLCIAEKEVFVVETVADRLIEQMLRYGSVKLSSYQLEELMRHIMLRNCQGEPVINRQYVGKDVQIILEAIGLKVPRETRLAIAEVPKNHPLVTLEQLMPVLPIVRVRDVDEAINEAYRAEQNNFHTALMYSKNVDHLSKMARKMNTTIFVKNAPSYAGLGMDGEGFASYTLASPTGEGVTSPVTFTRQRRCVLKDQFRIV